MDEEGKVEAEAGRLVPHSPFRPDRSRMRTDSRWIVVCRKGNHRMPFLLPFSLIPLCFRRLPSRMRRGSPSPPPTPPPHASPTTPHASLQPFPL